MTAKAQIKPPIFSKTIIDLSYTKTLDDTVDGYGSPEVRPIERVLTYIVKSESMKNRRNFAKKMITYEVRKLLRTAKVGKLQLLFSFNKYNHMRGGYSSSAIKALERCIGEHGGIKMNEDKDKKTAAYAFKSEADMQALLSLKDKKEILLTEKWIKRIERRNNNHIDVSKNMEGAISLYEDFVSDDIEHGGLGYPWEWIMNGGNLSEHLERGAGSLVRRKMIEAEEKIAKNTETYQNILGGKQLEIELAKGKLNESRKRLASLMEMAKEKGLHQKPEIKELLKQLEEIKKGMTT